MKKVTLTEKEEMVLRAIISWSNFTAEKIDITKKWGEQPFEYKGGNFWAIANTRDYGCGMDKQECRDIFGSLDKKGMIRIIKDDVTWILIDEKQFKKIKASLR